MPLLAPVITTTLSAIFDVSIPSSPYLRNLLFTAVLIPAGLHYADTSKINSSSTGTPSGVVTTCTPIPCGTRGIEFAPA